MKPKKVGVLGPFGWGNLGDAAIQQAMIEHIRQHFPGVQIYGFSLNPVDTEARHGIPSFPISRWGEQGIEDANRLVQWLVRHTPSKIGKWIQRIPYEFGLYRQAYHNLKGFDALFISGGGQLDDYWGGAWSHPYTLMKFTSLARIRGAKVFFVSVGAGPLDTRLGRLFDRLALTFANYRSYRDEKSKNYIANVVGFRKDDPVYPDLAFSLLGLDLLLSQKEQQTEKIIGINPMSYFDPRIWPEKDQDVYMNYLGKLAEFILWLIPQGYKILLFPGEAIHDTQAGKDLLAILAKSAPNYPASHVILPQIESVEELLAHLAAVQMVVASRFHSVLLSKLLHKPIVALSYHPKVDALMTDTGQTEYCLQIHDFEVNILKERFSALAAVQDLASQQISSRVQQYRTALDEQYDHIFRSI
ncbi:MAG: polysaccharide pyruvyl transferase family protein [Anaerolineales bacterium]|nr:polysaccharide pyruvyl transferase family protein [Anaerolineales bacterium]